MLGIGGLGHGWLADTRDDFLQPPQVEINGQAYSPYTLTGRASSPVVIQGLAFSPYTFTGKSFSPVVVTGQAETDPFTGRS